MNNIMLSVIIPLYNKEKYLADTLESVLEQTFTESEILIINDGSTDNSLIIAKEFEEKSNRIRIISQNNSGASAARNKGIEEAKGKYIIMLDADDTIDSKMHEVLVLKAEEYQSDIVACNYNFISNGKTERNSYGYPCNTYLERAYITQEIIPNAIGLKNTGKPISAHVTLLIKRKLLIDNNIRYNEGHKKEEDKPFIMHCMKYAQSIVFTEEYLYNYISHSESLIHQYSPRFDNINRNLSFYEELFGSIYDFAEENWARYYISIFEESIRYVLVHNNDVADLKDEIMHIICYPKSKKMFLSLSEDYEFVRRMYNINNTNAIYRYYMKKYVPLRIKMFVRNLLKR